MAVFAGPEEDADPRAVERGDLTGAPSRAGVEASPWGSTASPSRSGTAASAASVAAGGDEADAASGAAGDPAAGAAAASSCRPRFAISVSEMRTWDRPGLTPPGPPGTTPHNPRQLPYGTAPAYHRTTRPGPPPHGATPNPLPQGTALTHHNAAHHNAALRWPAPLRHWAPPVRCRTALPRPSTLADGSFTRTPVTPLWRLPLRHAIRQVGIPMDSALGKSVQARSPENMCRRGG